MGIEAGFNAHLCINTFEFISVEAGKTTVRLTYWLRSVIAKDSKEIVME